MCAADTPWWAQSPSPYSLLYWAVLCFLGARQMKPRGPRQWLKRFLLAGMLWGGLTLFPVDMMWLACQWLRFGSLYPEEWILIASCYVRDIGLMFLFWVNGEYTAQKEGLKIRDLIEPRNVLKLAWIVPFYVAWFLVAADPSWTDWTYALRFGYPVERVVASFFVSHVLLKALMAACYLRLYRKRAL